MKLNHQIFPEDADLSLGKSVPLLIIPGLFGSISNWRSIARKLSAKRTVIVVDQRNHGKSPHAASQTYNDMVGDIVTLLADLGLSKVDLAGHSMGGKVAMLVAYEHPEIIDSLTVLDIAPVTYDHSHAPFLESLLELDLANLQSRGEADELLQAAIPDKATRLFLLQSLTGSPGSYSWRLNLKVLYEYMPEIVAFPEVEGSCPVETLVLAGEQSTYLRFEHHAKLQKMFPNITIQVVQKAGHWLHAEQPEVVISEMEEFLQK